jgi:alpha-1,2-mannosyltransferase
MRPTGTWLAAQRFLNKKRLAYAWLLGGALWAGWLLSMLLGSGQVDMAGQAVGTDYVQFYAAGYTLRLGQSAQLYDVQYQLQLEQHIIGPRLTSYHAFITPPFLAWLFVPLAALPYLPSFALWSLLGLASLWLCLRALGVENPWRAFAWSLTWFPIFATISYGQNSLLSLGLLCLTYWLWRKDRLWAAGLACSLLMYKPQLIIGVGLLWLLEWRKYLPALLGLAVGSGVLAFLCFWRLPAASWAYVTFARTVLPDLTSWQDFPIWHLHTVRGFWQLLLPHYHGLADALYGVIAAGGLAGFVLFWRKRRDQHALLFAGAICLTLWVSPHAMIYDWAVLLIPAIVLWQYAPQYRQDWKVLYALIWVVTLVSGPLTYAQLHWLPFALQISVPILLAAIYAAYRLLRRPSSNPQKLAPANPDSPELHRQQAQGD